MTLITTEQKNLCKDIKSLLVNAKQTVAIAETTTGGLISALLLSETGASKYFLGGSVLYTYKIRDALIHFTKEEHKKYYGPKPELILEMSKKLKKQLPEATWIIGEGGAAGPEASPYGQPAGYTAIAIYGPITKTKVIETGLNDRIKNMEIFATESLKFFLEVLKEYN